ncbi:MAG TPA: hypothetical protein VD835_04715 [Pyrinomonadaceae bacterium]|nr:hypothetical protein [Pyrinomonadaceae bacterium]
MPRTTSTDFAKQKAAISGRLEKEYEFTLRWWPEYVKEFTTALKKVPNLPLQWKKCKFTKAAGGLIPKKPGVYCFTLELGAPFPKDIVLPLYVGKSPNQNLHKRFLDYFSERTDYEGREKVVIMLNMFRDRLFFWWVELPRVYVDIVEEHLIMCCKPPCNDVGYDKTKWGSAFD